MSRLVPVASDEWQVLLLAELDVHADSRSGSGREQELDASVRDWIDKGAARIEGDDGVVMAIGPDQLCGVFNDDPLAAVGTATFLQEWLLTNRRPSLPRIECRIAVVRGSFEALQWNGTETRGRPGYQPRAIIGPVARRATALARIAPAGGIILDANVVAELALQYVESRAGRARGWRGTDYLGPVKDLRERSTSPPITYYELKWSGDALLEEETPHPGLTDDTRPSRLVGEIINWIPKRDLWTLRAQNGETYSTTPQDLVCVDSVSVGDKVFFVPAPPTPPNRNPHARAVLVHGSRVRGTVRSVFPTRGYAFVEVHDRAGGSQDVFLHGEDNAWPLDGGQVVEFEVGENARGVAAQRGVVA